MHGLIQEACGEFLGVILRIKLKNDISLLKKENLFDYKCGVKLVQVFSIHWHYTYILDLIGPAFPYFSIV
jgi:hypothetical protein